MALPNQTLYVTLNFVDAITQAFATVKLYYQKQAGGGADPTVTTIITTANNFKTAFTAAIPGTLPSDVSVQAVHVRWLGSSADIDALNSNGVIAGSQESAYLPERSAVCIQRRTGQQGRNMRGRVFWPFVPASFNVQGQLESSGLTAYIAVGIMMKNNITDGAITWNPVTPNFKQNTMSNVVSTRVLTQIVSRKDRAYPRRNFPAHAA